MNELAAVDASVGMRVGIEELLQAITSPHVSVRVVADVLDLGGREWFGRRNVADDPRLAGCVTIDRRALGFWECRFADLAVNHDRGVRVMRSGDSREEVAEASFQARHHQGAIGISLAGTLGANKEQEHRRCDPSRERVHVRTQFRVNEKIFLNARAS